MTRKTWLILTAACVGGAAAASVLLMPSLWQPRTLTGPVAIIPAGGVSHGILGAVFSRQPGEELVIAEPPPAAPDDPEALRAGDRITSVNDLPVTTRDELTRVLTGYKPGDVVLVDVVRDAQPVRMRVRLMSLREAIAAHDKPTTVSTPK